MDRSMDHTFFQIKEVNDTTIQILLNKTLDDLVDRDTPHNLLKFKIHCSSINGRNEEVCYITHQIPHHILPFNFTDFISGCNSLCRRYQ